MITNEKERNKDQEDGEKRVKVDQYFIIGKEEEKKEKTIDDMLNNRIKETEKGSSSLKIISDDMKMNYNDGNRIFTNRLRFYRERAVTETMLSFKQLCYKDLGFQNKLNGESEVVRAILSTMVFEVHVLEPLLRNRTPITLFLERRGDKGPQVEYHDEVNMNLVY